MDLNARVDVNCGREDGRTDGLTDGQTENWTPMSHLAKAGTTNTVFLLRQRHLTWRPGERLFYTAAG